ncbi:nicotinamide-nucleotide amidase [Pseudarthrobacter equi]|uniref:Nicotinamide-nucleotide amidase n=1 Tax=Pseudarthrobacter equi TaxID=728066 RepID=A0A1H1XVT1_9MICC|nr:CinA family protein [Pseudarthrobacter equi]SDT13408.1 nicotinamide-nucleotide amidase [Pseudarthrobacter equi]
MTNLHHLAGEAVRQALEAGRTVATAESLTAGMVSAVLADTPGASGMLQGGVVAYQNSVKEAVLNVAGDLLDKVGSVDGGVASAMAAGARAALGADIGVSTTGVAGPEPHDGKPVGTVFVGIATAGGAAAYEYHFEGTRPEIRGQACGAALERLLEALSPDQARQEPSQRRPLLPGVKLPGTKAGTD